MKIISSTPLKKSRWPWPKMNANEVAERALGNEIFIPNIGYVDIGDVQEWSAELGSAANSKKLWINSLVTPHVCLIESNGDDNHKYFKKSADLIKAYLNQYDSGEGLFDIAWKDEHAVSNRLFVLCAFIHHLAGVEEASLSQLELLYHAERHAQWLSYDEHYVKNNHGVMMDLSLAQYSVLIRDTDPKQADAYLKIALRRLGMMLDDTFDSQGCCTENSPTYHFVNYSLFRSIFSFLKEYAKGFDLSGWEETLEKAKAVGALLLRPDGTVPLIGDSESRPGTFFPNVEPELSKGVGYYPEAGLFVLSDDSVHFTFRAGGSKYSHRHIDDLSITLWANGKDFIVDSGLYNYDIGDKLRRTFISSDSHSGFYLRSQGHVLFKNFNKPTEMSDFRHFHKLSPEEFEIEASHSLSKNADVFRKIEYHEGTFDIYDSFEAIDTEDWQCQFVLHPEVKIDLIKKENRVVLSRGSECIEMIFDGLYEGASIKIENSHYSEKFMQLQDTKKLIVKGSSPNLKLRTSIRLSGSFMRIPFHDFFKTLFHFESIELFSDPSGLVGEIGEISKLIYKRSPKKICEIFQETIKNKKLEMHHPTLGMKTRGIACYQFSGINFVLFADEFFNNPWLFVQHVNMVDLVVVEGEAYATSLYSSALSHLVPQLRKAAKYFEKVDLSDSYSKSYVHAFILDQKLPYHHFYDQLIYLEEVRSGLPVVDNINFYLPKGVPKVPERDISHHHILLKPCVISANKLKNVNNRFFDSLQSKMENSIYLDSLNSILPNSDVENGEGCYDLTLWYGVSSGKRSWKQQVSALVNIVNELTFFFPKILVFVDGMTSFEGEEMPKSSDDEVFLEIEKGTRDLDGCELVSLVGKCYREKVYFCSFVDAFVANAGTGAMVPLRFCKKPGVLHSNSKLNTFPTKDVEFVFKTSKDLTLDFWEEGVKKREDFLSYHIPWQHVYNLLSYVLLQSKGLEVPRLDVPDMSCFEPDFGAEKSSS